MKYASIEEVLKLEKKLLNVLLQLERIEYLLPRHIDLLGVMTREDEE